MIKTKNILNFFKIIIIPALFVFSTLFLCSNGLFSNQYYQFAFFLLNLGLIFLNYSLLVLEKTRLLKIFLSLIYIIDIFCFAYGMVEKYELIKYLTSIVYIRDLILKSGGKGVVIFVLIQILEVVCLPIPTIVIIIVGTLIYGPLVCFLLCSIGVFLGSICSFLIGRTFGIKLANWFFGKEKMDKYMRLVNKNGKFILFLFFLLPLFPDDILCVVAGVSKMKIKDFALITILTKPIGIFITSFFGTGIVPFEGWGVAFWIFIILLILIVFIFLLANKQKIKKILVKQ